MRRRKRRSVIVPACSSCTNASSAADACSLPAGCSLRRMSRRLCAAAGIADVGEASLDPLAAFALQPFAVLPLDAGDERRRVDTIGPVEFRGQDDLLLQIDYVLRLLRQMRAAIRHLGDLRVGVASVFSVVVGTFLPGSD